MTETGIVTKWVLVHNEGVLVLRAYLDNQTLVSPYTVELFDTEEEINNRMTELGFEIIVDE
ncbi:MAG: hypothetical protein CO099_06075 [Bdellovibrio sp. CG_4_9_14_3_um_filter_39_7]|nr:MAG: hypothetical protein CO099_06075 [Bdellovibrio sp. CG_4_9_14_3_um_filter_39_7]